MIYEAIPTFNAVFTERLPQSLLAAVLSAGAIGAVLNYFWLDPKKSSVAWKEQALERSIAPIVMNLDRTKIAYERYQKEKSFGFASMLYESNKRNRDILLSGGHLIPDELLEPANCLIAHYDIWIKRYEATLGERKLKPDEKFELGFADLSFEPCSEFPSASAKKFRDLFAKFRKDVKKDD
jgi:hypothetical protein